MQFNGIDGNRNDADDWLLARKGIQLVLNNKYDEARRLFENRGDSLPLSAGHLYVVFMNAVMTLEENDLAEASESLKNLESRCSQNLSWLQAVKNRVFGASQENSPYKILEEQITLADTQVCHAVLYMMTQDSTSGFVKGGWALRKAWGLYHGAYKELSGQYKKVCGFSSNIPEATSMWRISDSGNNTPISTPATTPVTPTEPPHLQFTEETSGGVRKKIAHLFSPVTTPQICPHEVRRLMCAVSFGYGLFHLCVSFLPSNVLKLVHFLGFASDRQVGIEALIFSRTGPDMRAPLASLALLWYYTIINPVFSHFNSENISSNVEEAENIITESSQEFSESSLFLFFKGRLFRLKNKIEEAVTAYLKAVKYSGRRELAVLCFHEVGWCYLMQLDFTKALNAFIQLRKNKSIKHFYSYLAAICYGSMGDMNHVATLSQAIRRLEFEKSCEIDSTIARRTGLLLPTRTSFYYRVLVYEMLYLWDSLPAPDNITFIIRDCEAQGDIANPFTDADPIIGLRPLIIGVCLGRLGKTKEAIDSLRSVISLRNNLSSAQEKHHRHVSAFAMYELASFLIKERKNAEAKGILETVLRQYANCDFENRLKLKIHSALQDIAS